MPSPGPLSPLHQRYLALLGLAAEPPGAPFLARLVRAQLLGCPFENLSKLRLARRRGLRRLPTLEEHLEGLERDRLGGTCYANNWHLYGLLRALGFDADLCGADMDSADQHAVVLVRTEAGEHLVDGGYAAPFFAPIALDAGEVQRLSWGNDAYAIWPRDARGRTRVDHLRDGQRVHGYTVNPAPRTLEHFAPVIGASLEDGAHFMKVVRFERFFPTGSVSLLDERLRVVDGDRCTFETLEGRAGILDALVQRLGVPAPVAEDALAALP